MLTVKEVKEHLGIDYTDTMIENNLQRLIKTADSYLKGSIGESYPDNDPRAVEIALLLISDLYENRELGEKVSGNVRRIVNDMSEQLRLEMKED